MHFEEEDVLLRIFLGESDVYCGKPATSNYRKARELNLSAQLSFGEMGFGRTAPCADANLLLASTDLPL
jgi:PII-like signaling protein